MLYIHKNILKQLFHVSPFFRNVAEAGGQNGGRRSRLRADKQKWKVSNAIAAGRSYIFIILLIKYFHILIEFLFASLKIYIVNVVFCSLTLTRP